MTTPVAASYPVMVRVLPNGVLITCGKPLAMPPVITLTPCTVMLCTPSGALMVKLPVWVSAEGFGALPSPRFFSKTVSSPPFTFRPLMTTGSLRLLTFRVRVAVVLSPSASLRV
ncbi:hypothetical protein D3C80_1550300 [compost metagenome]